MKLIIDTELNMIEVDGVKVALTALMQIVQPDPNALVQFERKGDQIQAHVFHVKEGQSGD